jgi:flagellar hook-length control protein FliK
MYAEIFAVDLNSADQTDFDKRRSFYSRKNKSRFADLLEENGRQVKKEKSFKKKKRADHMNKTSAEKNTGRNKNEPNNVQTNKELEDLKKRLKKELELDDPQRASELVLFMLENDLNLEEMLNFLNEAEFSAQVSELSAESKAELTNLLNTELNAENGKSNTELDFQTLESRADAAELLKNDSELSDLLKNSEESKLDSLREVFDSAGEGKNDLELQKIESKLREMLAQLSDQNSSDLQNAKSEEIKMQNLISKLLQNITSSDQQAEGGPAEIVKEFPDGSLLAQLNELLAENDKKNLFQIGSAEENVKTKVDGAANAVDQLLNTDQISSQKISGDLDAEVSALFKSEKESSEADIFNAESNLEYFNFNSESRASFELAQNDRIDQIQPNLNIEDQIMETFKAEYSAENRELTVELEPASLGRIDISLSYEDDKLIGKMLVQNELIRSSLEKSLNTLKTELVKEGINIEQFKIQTSENRPTQLEQQDQFAFNQDQSRFGDADSGQNQDYQQRNAFRQNNFSKDNSVNNYEKLDSSIKNAEFNYGWKQNALNLLA